MGDIEAEVRDLYQRQPYAASAAELHAGRLNWAQQDALKRIAWRRTGATRRWRRPIHPSTLGLLRRRRWVEPCPVDTWALTFKGYQIVREVCPSAALEWAKYMNRGAE
jgi:hypothetical protein